VRHAHALFGRGAFLGRARVRIPGAGEPPAEGWWPLTEGEDGKHASELAAAARRAGRPPGAFGELRLRLAREEAGAEAGAAARGAPETPPREEEATAAEAEEERHGGGGVRAGLSRAARAPVAAVRALLPTPPSAHRRRRRAAAASSEGSSEDEEEARARAGRRRRHRRHPAARSHIHVAVVAARNLLPSDFKARADASSAGGPLSQHEGGPTSDPYVTARLLPGAPAEERRSTAVKRATLNPVWEVRTSVLRRCVIPFIALMWRARVCVCICAFISRGARASRRRSSSFGRCRGRTASSCRRAHTHKKENTKKVHRSLSTFILFSLCGAGVGPRPADVGRLPGHGAHPAAAAAERTR
jgi:hypothetical protein